MPEVFRMKRFFFVLTAGIFVLCTHVDAQGPSMGGGGAPAYSQSGHPMNTAHNSNQALQTARDSQKPSGPAHVSVTVAAEEKGSPGINFPAKTPRLYGSFTTTGTNKGDRVHAVWLNASTKKALYKTDMVSTEPNFTGTVSINAPPAGWPAGKYELDIYLGNKMAARAAFNMKGPGQ
jgi:hypothetical protein